MQKHPEIEQAIEIAGSQPRLAELTGISQQHISKMLRGQRHVSADVALAIERATEGKIGRSRLRPDYWPPGDPPAPQQEGAR